MQKKVKFTVIEFRNIPQQIKLETQLDLYKLIQKTCESINTSIEPSDIKDIYRLSSRTGTSTVVTELNSILCKNKIIDAIKEFNTINYNNKLSSATVGLPGPAVPIYISESLTNKDRKLFALARDTAKSLQYKFCWTKRGKIFMKKSEGETRIEIKNEADLTNLQKK